MLAAALALTGSVWTATDTAIPVHIPGVWSVGDTDNRPAGSLNPPAGQAAY